MCVCVCVCVYPFLTVSVTTLQIDGVCADGTVYYTLYPIYVTISCTLLHDSFVECGSLCDIFAVTVTISCYVP